MQASDMIKRENAVEIENEYGYEHGTLNDMLLGKEYVYNNSKLFEQYARQSIYNHGHLQCSLTLYYLRQEPDFESWYKEHERHSSFVGH
jgi:hypothetical protein